MSRMLDAQEVLRRLCDLQSQVRDAIGKGEPADCFCREGGFWKCKEYGPTYADGYRNAGVALAFIEKTVRKALKERHTPKAPRP